jgi:hypothetical protein
MGDVEYPQKLGMINGHKDGGTEVLVSSANSICSCLFSQ